MPAQAARLLVDDATGAADGLALDEALLSSYARGAAPTPPTVRLYTYADHCALVGRYQHLAAEVDQDRAQQLGIALGRRPTGGGAIIMGSGQLGVAVAMRAGDAERPRDVMARMAGGITAGLRYLGIEAAFRGKNDLEVEGKKVAGLGLYADGKGGMLFHASVLADLDLDVMLSVLRIPAAKLGNKGVALVKDRVATVSSLLGRSVGADGIREAVARGFSDSLGMPLAQGAISADEAGLARALAGTKYSADEWIHERQPRSDTTASAVVSTKVGLVRCYISLQGGLVKNVLFTGDFNDLPAELAEIEKILRWHPLDRELLHARLEALRLTGESIDALGLVDALIKAAQAGRPDPDLRDQESPGKPQPSGQTTMSALSAPVRTGSCYFPEVSCQ